MSLPSPAPRQHLHSRSIHMEGFQRDDGLYDIEARVIDTKTYPVDHPMRGRVEAGSPWHDMQLRLTVDADLNVRDIDVTTSSAPYPDCWTVAPAYKALVGANLARGFRKAVNDAVGGIKGCTHLKELLMPAATTAFQTISGKEIKLSEDNTRQPAPGEPMPFYLGACKAWALDSAQVLRFFPGYYTQKDKEPT